MAYNYEYPYTDPNLYNDDWLLKKMKELLAWMEATDQWKEEYEEAYEELKELYEEIESGNFPDSFKKAFSDWMSAHAVDIVGGMVKNVFFGILDDGHFCAWIPDSWDDIIFNTTYYDIVLTAHPEYKFGHLVLSY